MRPTHRPMALASVLVLVLGALGASPVAAGSTFSINYVVNLGLDCLLGTLAPEHRPKFITIRNAAGDLKAWERSATDFRGEGLVPADGSNDQFDLCLDEEVLETGDRIEAWTPGSSTPATGGTFVVPRLTLRADRVTDTVTGNGPKNSQVRVSTRVCPGFEYSPSCPWTGDWFPTSSTGAYSASLSSANPRGGDSVGVEWRDTIANPTRMVVRNLRFPYVNLWLGRDRGAFDGWLNRSQLTTITLKSSSGTLLGSGQGLGDSVLGRYRGVLRKSNGDRAYPVAGNQLAGNFASDARFRVPTFGLSVDGLEDVISGSCMPNRPVFVWMRHDPEIGWEYHEVTGTASSTGAFSFDVTGDFNIEPYDTIHATCRFATGDQVTREMRVPYFVTE